VTLSIDVQTIPHKEQRYDTAGDWFDVEGKYYFKISDCRNKKYEWLLAIHEIVERALCDVNGVSADAVDKFDTRYRGEGEPGDAKNSPYQREHCYATAVERMLCAAMGVSWKEYDDFVSKL
jgi:hypothetical protein